MKEFPIYIAEKRYNGLRAGERKRISDYNRVAVKVQNYINDIAARWPSGKFGAFFSFEIASNIREDNQLVHKVVQSIDGGTNGVTVIKI